LNKKQAVYLYPSDRAKEPGTSASPERWLQFMAVTYAALQYSLILNFMRKTKLLLFVSGVILLSCTMSNTKTKDPVISDMSTVQNELTNLVKAENINLNGKEITTNNKTTSELEVSITNGVSIPTNDTERKALGKAIATSIKRNLKDPNEYDKYTVLFVTKVESDAGTKRDWEGDSYSSTEL
jgi:hypothetical protein